MTLEISNSAIHMRRKLSKLVNAKFIAPLIALFHHPHQDLAKIAILTLSFVVRDVYSSFMCSHVINLGVMTPLLDLIKTSSSVNFYKYSTFSTA